LGWMRPNLLPAQYNFGLVGYHIGQAAVDIGGKIVEADAEGRIERAKQLTGLLITLLDAINGDQAILNSGLLNSNHANLASARASIQQIDQKIRAIAKAGLDLAISPTSQRPLKRDTVSARAAELRAFLAKSPPNNWALFPGGPEFKGPQIKVVEPKREKPKSE